MSTELPAKYTPQTLEPEVTRPEAQRQLGVQPLNGCYVAASEPRPAP